MAPHLYSFFESSSEDDTFHIQCEWFNKGKLDLENENLDQDNNSTVYCLVTVTDLKDYYTRAITRELLQTNFKESNALHKEHRNTVLEAAFLGEQSYYGNRLHWRIIRDEETHQLNMRLRTFNGDIALRAGSFCLDKASPEQAQELEQSWFKHGSIASQTNIEITKALKQRNQDIKKTNTELRLLIEIMERRQIETSVVTMDKFVHLLNAKKRKIYYLQNSIRRKRRRALQEEAEAEAKAKAEAVAKIKEEQQAAESQISQPQKHLKTDANVKEEPKDDTKNPDQNDEESDWELSDSDINPPQTVR